jgi:hypothetical protein
MTLRLLLIFLAVIGLCLPSLSQDRSSSIDKITGFPQNFFSTVNKKAQSLESRLDRQTEKYLQRLLKKEKKLQKKLLRTDSTAVNIFNNSEEDYATLRKSFIEGQGSAADPASHQGGQYIPAFDSLKSSLSFLQQNGEYLSSPENVREEITGTLSQVNALQSKLDQSEAVKVFIRKRKEQIKQALSRYTKLPTGLSRTYNNFNKDIYYYTQQVREYKELLNNPDKLTRKAFETLSRSDLFKRFMQQHSELAALFPVPDNFGTPQALAGLQTRTQVQQLIQTQLSAAGPNAQQLLQQNLQAAQQQLNNLKDKVNKLGGSSGDTEMDMPEFKPNHQKTKSFLQRLEVGTNLQSSRSNNFFPSTTDMGLSVGYKISDKTVIGIGASYKIGWGKDIRNIAITSEGAGLRSFLDIKLKGSFFMSGGYEYNHQPAIIPVNNGDPLQSAWTQSGLVGLTKIVSLKTKFFKKTKMQLLWDFLSYRQEPRTQALKFRIGYSF